MLGVFLLWLGLSIFLIVCTVAGLIICSATSGDNGGGATGRMLSRESREQEQFWYSTGIPLTLTVVLVPPALVILYFLIQWLGILGVVGLFFGFVFLSALFIIIVVIKEIRYQFRGNND